MKEYIDINDEIYNKYYTILNDIEKFYYSEFWENRFKRRCREENIEFDEIELDCLLGAITMLKERVNLKQFVETNQYNGVSNKSLMIAINSNIVEKDLYNTLMHEFGHLQYFLKDFETIIELNSKILNSPSPLCLESKKDDEYFSNENEIRQRIIPIVKEMYNKKWSSQDAYNRSQQLKSNDLYEIYSKEQIIYWLDNIL